MRLSREQKTLLQRFNQPDVHLVVSRWPGKSREARFDGISTYTKETLTAFMKTQGARFVVFAEQMKGEPRISTAGKRILILRIFNPKKHSIFPSILTWLKLFPEIKTVVVHSEFCASVGPQVRMLIIPFLAMIKGTGRSITYYAHNVVETLAGLGEHLNMTGWKQPVMGFALRWYYRLLALQVDRFVVLEEVIKQRLSRLAPGKEIVLQPHWVRERGDAVSKARARKLLGIPAKKKVIVSFGFVTYYKGADWVTQLAETAFAKKNTDLLFVLAGGEAYTLKDQAYYQDYYGDLERRAAALPNLRLTGFLPESDIPLWFAAADLVLFPYRGLIGGSGSMSLALAYKKPIMVSETMYEALAPGDFYPAMKKARVSKKAITFSMKPGDLEATISRFTKPEQYAVSERMTEALCVMWSFERLVKNHYETVFLHPVEESLGLLLQNSKTFLLEWGRRVAYVFNTTTRN